MYRYLNSKKYPNAPKRLSAVEISNTKTLNKCSQETFELFVYYFARAARNFALDTLARGGLYIAGGIAARNELAGAVNYALVEQYGHEVNTHRVDMDVY